MARKVRVPILVERGEETNRSVLEFPEPHRTHFVASRRE